MKYMSIRLMDTDQSPGDTACLDDGLQGLHLEMWVVVKMVAGFEVDYRPVPHPPPPTVTFVTRERLQ